MASDRERKAVEREKLRNIINQWNANRLDIFWLSEPNEVSNNNITDFLVFLIVENCALKLFRC